MTPNESITILRNAEGGYTVAPVGEPEAVRFGDLGSLVNFLLNHFQPVGASALAQNVPGAEIIPVAVYELHVLDCEADALRELIRDRADGKVRVEPGAEFRLNRYVFGNSNDKPVEYDFSQAQCRCAGCQVMRDQHAQEGASLQAKPQIDKNLAEVYAKLQANQQQTEIPLLAVKPTQPVRMPAFEEELIAITRRNMPLAGQRWHPTQNQLQGLAGECQAKMDARIESGDLGSYQKHYDDQGRLTGASEITPMPENPRETLAEITARVIRRQGL